MHAEAVGKSSLISTFVSRYFSEGVPGIMTRVRLPPDPENSCVTTIVDSQGENCGCRSFGANRILSRDEIDCASAEQQIGSADAPLFNT